MLQPSDLIRTNRQVGVEIKIETIGLIRNLNSLSPAFDRDTYPGVRPI